MEKELIVVVPYSLLMSDLKTLIRELLEENREELKVEQRLKTVSINQASKILGCSHATIKNLVRSGALPICSDGKRISLTNINNYLKTN